MRSPGPINLPLNEELTVARAMMRIGFTQFAKQSRVILRRVDPEGKKQEIFVDVKEILETGNFEEDVPLQDGDMIKVDEGFINL